MIYEFELNLNFSLFVRILILVLPFCVWLFSHNFEKQFVRILLKLFSLVLLTFIVFSIFVYPIYQYSVVKKNIESGNTMVVEGEIADFISPDIFIEGHDEESFSINGVRFSYSGSELFGYCRNKSSGGIIIGNGQKVKITYFEFSEDDRVICFIELLDD